MSNKISLIQKDPNERRKIVSAEFDYEADLEEVLITLEGLIKALGFCFEGKLTIEETE